MIAATPPTTGATPLAATELYRRHYLNSDHVPNPADQRLELERARIINSQTAQQHKDRMEARQLVAGAALAEELGGLDVRDPQYRVKAAKLFAQYHEGVNAPAAQAVAKMKMSEFSDMNRAQSEHRTAVYNATLQKRIAPLLGSDAVPFDLKNQLMDMDGNFSADAVRQAEALHSANGGKSGAEFYSSLLKNHGLTQNDLDSVVADPSLVSYFGPFIPKHPDKGFGKVSSDTVLGQEDKYRALATLPNGGTPLNLPLNVFEALVNTHKNLSRQNPAAVAPTQASEQSFLDRQVQEASAKANNLPLITAAAPGYAEWLASKTSAAAAPTPDKVSAEYQRLLGAAPKTSATAVPVTPPQAAADDPVASAADEEE